MSRPAASRARRALAASLLSLPLALGAVAAQPSPGARERGEDFDAMWHAIDTGYAYFAGGGRAAWKQARAAWRARAVKAATRRDFLAALEGALDTLGDDHVMLSQRTAEAPRRVPGETDIWARWKDGNAVVEAVRTFGDADVAGLKPGDAVTRVQGRAVDEAVRERAGDGADPQARDRALRRLLAGPRFGVLRLEVRDERGARTVAIERASARASSGTPLLARRVGEERDIGYVRLKGEDDRLVERLDAALGYLADTRGLILDLRESAGPATRAATQAILARFAPAGTPWQIRESRAGTRTTDTVPNGPPPYGAPLLVLVDRWTEGEAEALAAGLHEAAHGRLVGTPSAGLRGDLRAVTLPHSRIAVRFPAERTLLLDGRIREALRPEIAVDLAAPSGGPGDPILYQALKAFEAPRAGAR